MPNFPDPSSGGGFRVPAGTDPASPAFKAAQTKCQKLLPGGGPGSGPPPSAQTLARYLKVARCMRQHGVSGFPDPTTSISSKPSGGGEIADREGVILVIPRAAQQSPEYASAAAACGFALTNH
ncbi:MAG TPA: hypothetical protein VME01_03500 [Solirubrobacteraceae bacterium]|nr:hypothetical protein [Solirubrobacteraceae bacterium]